MSRVTTTPGRLPLPEWDICLHCRPAAQSREVTHSVRFHGRVRELPSRETLTAIIKDLYAALFPTHFGRHDLNDESIDFFVGATLNDALLLLNEQIRRGLQFAPGFDGDLEARLRAEAIVATRAFAMRCRTSAICSLPTSPRPSRAIPRRRAPRKYCSATAA